MRDIRAARPGTDLIQSMTDMEFRFFAQACLICAFPEEEKIVLVGGTDLALFAGIPRWSEDIDYKHRMRPRTLLAAIRENLKRKALGVEALHIPQGHVLKDKFNIRVVHTDTSRSAFVPINQITLPSLTGRAVQVPLFGRAMILMRETEDERVAEKLAAVGDRILNPYRRNEPFATNWRDLYDIAFLDTLVDRKQVARLFKRKKGSVAALYKLSDAIHKGRKKAERAVRDEMENLLYDRSIISAAVAESLHVPVKWSRFFERSKDLP